MKFKEFASKEKYTEDDINKIKELLKKNKKITDNKLLKIYNDLKDAGIFK